MPISPRRLVPLRQALEYLGKARPSTAVAQEKAGRIAVRVGQSGFRGVAERVAAVEEAIKRVQGTQAAVALQLDDAVVRLEVADSRTSPQGIVTTMSPSSVVLDQQCGATA